MLGTRYVVVKGDNLWHIARGHLRSGAQWPRIWCYNNRPEVIRDTGRGIPNPDLIYVGQVLLIPLLPTGPSDPAIASVASPPDLIAAVPPQPPTAKVSSPQPLRQSGPLERQLPTLQLPVSLKFRLDDIRTPPVVTPTATIEFRMAGDVVLASRSTNPALSVTSRNEIEAQVTREMNHAFGKLIQDNRFIFNVVDRSVTLRSMLVSQSNTPNAPSTAIGVEASSGAAMPKLRAEIRFPKLAGRIDQFNYVAVDVKFIIEITPKLQMPPGPSPQPIRVAEPVRVSRPSIDWSTVIGTGLVVTAGVIVVATVVEDFLTMGVGTADDPASFAVAAAALARGLSMIRGVAAALPQAVAPASGMVGATVQMAR